MNRVAREATRSVAKIARRRSNRQVTRELRHAEPVARPTRQHCPGESRAGKVSDKQADVRFAGKLEERRGTAVFDAVDELAMLEIE